MPATPVEFILMFSTGVVAFALLLSGASKVGRTGRTLESMTDLRVPQIARRSWVAAAVPIGEIALGVALVVLPGWYRTGAAMLALATFATFTVFVFGVLRRGEEVDCGCFGALSVDDRVTGWTVIRNVLLIAMSAATAITAIGRSSFLASVVSFPAPLVLAVSLAWALLAIVALSVTLRKLRARITALAPDAAKEPGPTTQRTTSAVEGDPIPDAELVDADGVTLTLRTLGAGNPVLLVFLSAECGKCSLVARRLPEWQESIGPSVVLRVLTSSRPQVLRERMPEVLPYALFGSGEARRALGVAGSPSAVLLGGLQHPFVASPIARREDEIDALIRGVVDAQARAST